MQCDDLISNFRTENPLAVENEKTSNMAAWFYAQLNDVIAPPCVV